MRRSLALLLFLGCATTKPQRLARHHIQDAMLEHRGELVACATEELRRSPGSHGKVLLHFRIKPSGQASDVSAEGVGPELASCLRQVVSAVRFPAHELEGPELITWPLQY